MKKDRKERERKMSVEIVDERIVLEKFHDPLDYALIHRREWISHKSISIL